MATHIIKSGSRGIQQWFDQRLLKEPVCTAALKRAPWICQEHIPGEGESNSRFILLPYSLSQLELPKQNTVVWGVKPQKCISHSSGHWKSGQETSVAGFHSGPSFWSTEFGFVSPSGQEMSKVWSLLLIKTLIPSWGPHPQDTM